MILVVHNRRRQSHIKYPCPDEDVRENIISYDDEGGGEDDMTAFDIKTIQIPVGDPPPPQQPMKIPCNFNKLLHLKIKCSIASDSAH